MFKPIDQTGPSRRKSQSKNDLRDRNTEDAILQAARVVFTRRGTAGARIQEIATEAGVNQALIHYYFRSKAALAERVFVDAARKVLGELIPAVAASADLESLVRSFVTTYIGEMRKSPFLPGYLLAEVTHHPERWSALVNKATGVFPADVARLALERLQRLIQQSVQAGKSRDIPPRDLMINTLSLVVFPFAGAPFLKEMFQLDDDTFDAFLAARARELPGFILNAIRP